MAIESGILDQVTQQFLEALSHDGSLIQKTAEMLFYYLVVIQLALSAIWMTLAGESLQKFLTRLVQMIFSFSFFYGLIQFGGQWIPQLLNGFIHLGQLAGVTSLDPSSIVDQGMSISGAIFKGFFGWGLLGHPWISLVGAIVCISILVLYGLMAAELAIVLVKSYILIATGGLFFAFGTSDYTQDMAKNYFRAAIGLGLQLMSLYLLLGVGQNIGSEWASMTALAAENHELMPMLVILAAVIVYYMILKNIPPFIAGLSSMGGFRNYGDAAVGMAINAGMSGANTLSNVKGLSGKGIQGLTQAGIGIGHALSSGFQGFRQGSNLVDGISKGAMSLGSHLGSATANTVKNMAMRQKQHLSTGQKFNQHMANKVKGK